MNRCYIAAPIFNQNQLKVVTDITVMLKLLGFEYFSPYESSQAIWKGRAPKDCSPEERAQVLQGNIDNLHWADVLVAWVGGTTDGRLDTGVVWEMGYFHALGRVIDKYALSGLARNPKLTIAYIHPTDKRQHMNLMLAGTVDAVACGPAQLHRALEILQDRQSRTGNASMDAVWIRLLREKFHPDKVLMQEKEPIV